MRPALFGRGEEKNKHSNADREEFKYVQVTSAGAGTRIKISRARSIVVGANARGGRRSLAAQKIAPEQPFPDES